MSHRRQRLRKIDIQIGLDLNTENNYTKKVKKIVKFSQEKIGDFMLRFFLFIHSFFIDVLLPKTTMYDKIKLNKFLEFEEV